MLREGRGLLLALFGVLAAGLATAAASDRLVAAWARLGVPALDPSFTDLRAYTSGWECTRAGIDVFVANPCDPWNRALVPPRLPESLAFLGLGESSTVPLALAAIALFVLCVLVVAGPLSYREALLYAAVVCSPSLLLGIERANTDLIVFALLTAMLVTFRRPSPWLRALAHAALLAAALVKLYPIAAATVLLRQPQRRAAVSVAAAVVPFALYALAIRHDLELAVENMTRSTRLSYGAGVAGDAFADAFALAPPAATAIAVAGVAGLVVAAVLLAARIGSFDAAGDERALDAFWVGASAYVATFFVGHNFDYKLVVLVFTVPQLLRWARSPAPAMPHASWALGALVATLWLSASVPVVPGVSDAWIDVQLRFPLEEALNWVLFVYLAAGMLVTAPRWLRLAVGHPRALPSRTQ